MRIVCESCMHRCSLGDGQRGICRARKNENGRIICENYGMATSLALDPIEKKPLKRFRSGSMILSVGSYGCNLRCPFCQNHEISMIDGETAEETVGAVYLSPEWLANKATECREEGNIGVAFTYNEPLVGWEYVRDTAKLVKEAGMDNVLVTNGSASLGVLEEILPYIDAMNIDLKGFRADYYKKLGGDLETVKRFIASQGLPCRADYIDCTGGKRQAGRDGSGSGMDCIPWKGDSLTCEPFFSTVPHEGKKGNRSKTGV